MYKAVLFDLVNTLVCHDPPPELRQQQTLQQFGIEASKENLRRGFWAANDYFSREAARSPIEKRSDSEKIEVFIGFEIEWLKEAGHNISREMALELLSHMRSEDPGIVPFEDTIPVLTELRQRGMVLGLVSNLDTTLDRFCPNFNLAAYLDFVIVSHEAGFEKPQKEIFEAALKQAKSEPSETIMVGDQFHSDMAGAIRTGIKPLWLDRDNIFEDHADCQRIGGLMEIKDYL